MFQVSELVDVLQNSGEGLINSRLGVEVLHLPGICLQIIKLGKYRGQLLEYSGQVARRRAVCVELRQQEVTCLPNVPGDSNVVSVGLSYFYLWLGTLMNYPQRNYI